YALEQAARLAIVQFNARNLRPFERILEILEAAGVAFGGPGPEFLRGKFLDNRAHAAVVIDARMGHDQVIDPKNFPRAQKRRDDRLAGVEVRGGSAAGVDQRDFRPGQLDHRRSALADVEMSDAQILSVLALAAPKGAA